jgi:hypothetical protein
MAWVAVSGPDHPTHPRLRVRPTQKEPDRPERAPDAPPHRRDLAASAHTRSVRGKLAGERANNAFCTAPLADVQDVRMPRRPRMAESGLDPIGKKPTGDMIAVWAWSTSVYLESPCVTAWETDLENTRCLSSWLSPWMKQRSTIEG